ncbi:MAG: outer membrane protein transport protein [Gammaproteobacteria bacterium]|nr:outer membrane protein transport protein [Gammaproteobacteria bacterium]
MSSGFNKTLIAASISSVLAAPAVYATNGMNIEGYGPIAAGMGGASMAYENGSAATMNNPATLGLMTDGQSRLEVALGFLGPDVTAIAGPMEAKSGGDAYYMPAVGWTKKEGKLSYGVGMFAQGGMGTEYEANSFLAAGTGEAVRSEVGVGRLLAPIAYNVNDTLTIGGTVDFVWAGMDLKMAMTGSDFMMFVPAFGGGGPTYPGIASGTMVDGLAAAVGGGQITGVNWVRFDFSNTNDFTGEATSTGYGGKIGFVAKEGKLTIGGTYHFKTSLADMEANGATLSMNVNGPMVGGGPATVPITGTVKVVDFQWPATLGVGLSYQATDKVMVAVDVKQIMWSDVMDSFRMSFTADNVVSNGSFAGASMDLEMYQNWKDQTAIQFGAAYKMDDALTLRAGMNVANNPVPDAYMNPLFPAIEENHVTAGVGYKIGDNQGVDFALMHALDVTQDGGSGVTVTHSQLSWQLMYTMNF